MKTDREITARRMEQVRRELEMSQEQLAAALGIGQSTASKYLRGQRPPTVEVLWHLSRLSGRPMEWFIGGTETAQVAEPAVSYGTRSWEERLRMLPAETRAALEHLLETLLRTRGSGTE